MSLLPTKKINSQHLIYRARFPASVKKITKKHANNGFLLVVLSQSF